MAKVIPQVIQEMIDLPNNNSIMVSKNAVTNKEGISDIRKLITAFKNAAERNIVTPPQLTNE